MQTFVPYPEFKSSAMVLDYRRLGKQRVETFQLLRVNHGLVKGWANHPASKMWRGHESGLIAYGVAMCEEWKKRGYKDTCLEKILAFGEPDVNDLPLWWGDDRVHSSHRANLLRKDSEWYSQFNWNDNPEDEYYWPVMASSK
jgi:hypothetical protein